MYEMYRWNQSDPAMDGGGRTPASGTSRAAGPAGRRPRPVNGTRRPGRPGTDGPGPAALAVQVALDRRDNGGDPAALRDQ